MIPRYSPEDYEKAKTKDLLPCECAVCHQVFYKAKREIAKVIKGIKGFTGDFCSQKCKGNSITSSCLLVCDCGATFTRQPAELKKVKKPFCSHSCSAKFNNTNKSFGFRRSKLEHWLEEQLTVLYPTLLIRYNDRSIMGLELDISLPTLKLAFELNGIFHYEPIYGFSKLNSTKSTDQLKHVRCQELHIELITIDVSQQKKFTISNSQPILGCICSTIERVRRVELLRTTWKEAMLPLHQTRLPENL